MFKDILSSATSIWNAEKNRDFNYDAQSRAQDFTAAQSATMYQRMVEDLNKAGLSPMLAYSKTGHAGAGSAATSNASIEAPQFGASDLRKSQAELAKEQIDVAKSTAQLNTNSAIKAAADADASDKLARKYEQETENLKLFPGMSDAQIAELKSRSGFQTSQASKVEQDKVIDEPRARFSQEEPEKAKWLHPLQAALSTIFGGVGLLRGSAAMPFVTQNAPRDGQKGGKK
jgi:hypothetical protein